MNFKLTYSKIIILTMLLFIFPFLTLSQGVTKGPWLTCDYCDSHIEVETTPNQLLEHNSSFQGELRVFKPSEIFPLINGTLDESILPSITNYTDWRKNQTLWELKDALTWGWFSTETKAISFNWGEQSASFHGGSLLHKVNQTAPFNESTIQTYSVNETIGTRSIFTVENPGFYCAHLTQFNNEAEINARVHIVAYYREDFSKIKELYSLKIAIICAAMGLGALIVSMLYNFEKWVFDFMGEEAAGKPCNRTWLQYFKWYGTEVFHDSKGYIVCCVTLFLRVWLKANYQTDIDWNIHSLGDITGTLAWKFVLDKTLVVLFLLSMEYYVLYLPYLVSITPPPQAPADYRWLRGVPLLCSFYILLFIVPLAVYPPLIHRAMRMSLGPVFASLFWEYHLEDWLEFSLFLCSFFCSLHIGLFIPDYCEWAYGFLEHRWYRRCVRLDCEKGLQVPVVDADDVGSMKVMSLSKSSWAALVLLTLSNANVYFLVFNLDMIHEFRYFGVYDRYLQHLISKDWIVCVLFRENLTLGSALLAMLCLDALRLVYIFFKGHDVYKLCKQAGYILFWIC
ncbi:hypothetical protein WICPIJ_008847 [Wickerhamomyces pijperi]|uniref:Uncharacterized protein n=1 Tax=Wickerhamomyces pijperi TaxID=599730 RepID=A0A9P8PVI0_WICPI|nr:hypothetical protein WICPIJ_008847 [Wickerhamomyces pijperi]